ncbi:MAG: phosphoribosylformylglycinamidine synthase [Bacteroidales bacterium]|nr:phosphoribosylformylglycinamidine synthase [Bacteroidales bacterium]MBN2821293.1 phosphoribosylformylglycinamidine synthase [Bacteroidales bacterium]
MVIFFRGKQGNIIAVNGIQGSDKETLTKLAWLFSEATPLGEAEISGTFVGPRKEMITPWSTNAVEITQNMGISGIKRIEEFFESNSDSPDFDPMLQRVYTNLTQEIFTIRLEPEPIKYIDNIAEYNQKEGLALNADEVKYLDELSVKLNRKLTDSEIFGFSQVNSEHCRHKIFNGTFIIDGEEKQSSLFKLIKLTTSTNLNKVVSAYKDNCAFLSGPKIQQFAPLTQDKPDFFVVKDIDSVISLKAETHNFPTTVEPFNGAATGTGGEIRDRVAGGKAAIPLAGTAVYMTAYSRLEENREWENDMPERKWLYQSPAQILIKASNGASDFGNKFGQPLICGSVLTFEHSENNKNFGFDKVIMLAGGIGYGKKEDVEKGTPEKGDKIVLLGGDNYRIGMGGGAVSSVATGEFDNAIELNAVQRSNPEMQKRVTNAIRAMAESDNNTIVSIHDHGAGGHLNCLSELVEETGGIIEMSKLPVGDPTLSSKEIVGNESQERMGLVMKKENIEEFKRIAERERAPIYVIGESTGDHQFSFVDKDGNKPIDLQLADMFGNPPKTIMKDEKQVEKFKAVDYNPLDFEKYLEQLLQLEAVGCKDWLTNKVDRSVTGRVAKQQTAGKVQLPLNNVAVSALDYTGYKGIATSIGHAPTAALVDSKAGSILAITEAITNIIWAPIADGLSSVSLSANWMWPCKNPGEDARLYEAVEAASQFAIDLGINIPTGKDSLSMTQKYPDGNVVLAPGTVIISAAAEVSDFRKTLEPVLKPLENSSLLYIKLTDGDFELGGSSFAQVRNQLGLKAPRVSDANYLKAVFAAVQQLIMEDKILAGHDISSGGMITSILEMLFGRNDTGLKINVPAELSGDLSRILFSENPGLIIQVKYESSILEFLKSKGINAYKLGSVTGVRKLSISKENELIDLNIDKLRNTWFKTSWLLDRKQSATANADSRFDNYAKQELNFNFPTHFDGNPASLDIDIKRRKKTGVKAAIIREKGVNGDREMAFMMYLAGMDVKDVHMTDLISGRETLEDVNMIVFVGGFSNSDVLGSAKGWAGAFLYNEKAKNALDKFYARKDTLSLGVCNGCQLMMELNLVKPELKVKPTMLHNESHKFESAFLSVDIQENNSVMLKTLAGSRLGIWVAHGEGKFNLELPENQYNITMKYSHSNYPGNPNGSVYNAAGLCSADGRHLVMMPHLERAIFPWNWAYYPEERKNDIISPWVEAFVNAKKWIEQNS